MIGTWDQMTRAGTMNVLFDAAGTLDLYPGQATVPVGATSSGTGSATRTPGGRTVPGGLRIASGHEAPTASRG